jgi:hypothetical protein
MAFPPYPLSTPERKAAYVTAKLLGQTEAEARYAAIAVDVKRNNEACRAERIAFVRHDLLIEVPTPATDRATAELFSPDPKTGEYPWKRIRRAIYRAVAA